MERTENVIHALKQQDIVFLSLLPTFSRLVFLVDSRLHQQLLLSRFQRFTHGTHSKRAELNMIPQGKSSLPYQSSISIIEYRNQGISGVTAYFESK